MTRSYVSLFDSNNQVGSLDKSKKTVGTGLVGAPACGDVMKLQVGEEGCGSLRLTWPLHVCSDFATFLTIYRLKLMHQASSVTLFSRPSGEDTSFPSVHLALMVFILQMRLCNCQQQPCYRMDQGLFGAPMQLSFVFKF